jgi:AraC family transcriptional regulator, alkane utilization regulator
MTEMPEVLAETPSASTDPLSDMLGSMHVTGMVLFRAEFREPWSVITPDSCELAKTAPFNTEHIIPFHIIASGGCWLELPEREPVWLKDGDAVLLPYGDSHRLGGLDIVAAVHVGQLLPQPPWNDIFVVEHGGAGAGTRIICGFLKCDELLFHPILRHLPTVLHVSPDKTPADHWLATTIRHTAAEASKSAPGSRNMLPRLTELMFVEILRKHMQSLSVDEVGWFAAFNDPVAGAALRHLHTVPLQDWSVESLARRVGVSRTVLAGRFKRFLDQPPMQYLARWRLQLAAQELKTSDLPMKNIADQAGYESEQAFSRAFKRHFGLPPADWRRRQRSMLMG